MVISIITVVLNAYSNIKNTVESVKNQNYSEIEYIIIDGKSNDGTQEFLKENKDQFDLLIIEEDEGLYYAMNKGIAHAKGDFILFMNAGDIFCTDNTLSNIANLISNKDTLYYGNTIVYFNELSSIAPKLHHQSVFFPKCFYSTNFYKADKFQVTAEGDYIFRAESILKTHHFDENIIKSKLEGFRITRFKTLKGLKLMVKEHKKFYEENNQTLVLKQYSKYLIISIIKYLGFKLGGMPLVAKILLKSYK